MKKIVLSLLGSIIVSGIIGGNVFLNSHTKLDQKMKNGNVEIIETKQVSDSEIKAEKEETKKSEQNEKEENTEQVSNSEPVKENTKPEQTKKNTNNTSSDNKTETKNNTNTSDNDSTSSNQSQSKNNTTNTKPSNNTQNNSQNTTQPQKNVVSTTFYDSITGGKREFSSESAAFARGTEIQNKELDYVLDWNEAHPDNQIQPDINYFRVYPSAIDENGNYWYYLHFFCQSGEENDAKLKSKY